VATKTTPKSTKAPDDTALVNEVLRMLGTKRESLVLAVQQLLDASKKARSSATAAMRRVIEEKDGELAAKDAALAAHRGALDAAHDELAKRVKATSLSAEEAEAKVDGLIGMGRVLPGGRSFYVAFAKTDRAAFEAASATLPQIVPIGQRQALKSEARGMGTIDQTNPIIASFKRRNWSDEKIAAYVASHPDQFGGGAL
jgi:hypothetical protein